VAVSRCATSHENAAAGGSDKAGSVTQGRVSKAGHSSSAKRLVRSDGKSVGLVIELLLANSSRKVGRLQ
jgi:hypothetical protein